MPGLFQGSPLQTGGIELGQIGQPGPLVGFRPERLFPDVQPGEFSNPLRAGLTQFGRGVTRDVSGLILPRPDEGQALTGVLSGFKSFPNSKFSFHGTTPSNAEMILRSGKLNRGSFFSSSIDEAASFGRSKGGSAASPSKVFVVRNSDISPIGASRSDKFGKMFIEQKLATRTGKAIKPVAVIDLNKATIEFLENITK